MCAREFHFISEINERINIKYGTENIHYEM